MKKTLWFLLPALFLAGVYMANGAAFNIGEQGVTVSATGSLNSDQTQLAINVTARLSTHVAGENCSQDIGSSAPYSDWWISVGTSANATFSISGNSYGGVALSTIITPGMSGTDCFNPGQRATVSGSKTISISDLKNGSYTVAIKVTDNLGNSGVTNVNFTINNRPQCSDGVDNDTDGKIDYPNDPGCTSLTDIDEIDHTECASDFTCKKMPGAGSNQCSQDSDCAATSTPPSNNPVGYHDSMSGTQQPSGCIAIGWAKDPDSVSNPVTVKVYAGTSLLATKLANEHRDDLGGQCPGGNCAVSFDLWNLPGMVKYSDVQITLKAVDNETNTAVTLNNSPKTINCISSAVPQPQPDPTKLSITVSSNIATTWTLTGPSETITETSASLKMDYFDKATGDWTVTPVTKSGYTYSVSPGQSQNYDGTNAITFNITYTASGGTSYHYTCQSQSCVKVSGSGTNTCSSNSQCITTYVCDDNKDNDGDGKIDYPNDPGCTGPTDNDERDAATHFACQNNACVSVIGSGINICSADADCAPPPTFQCSDGQDNDGDGKIDYPADPGCLSSTDNDETDTPPPAACSDGQDNDGDGKIDYPADPGCTGPTDTDEYNPPPTACSDSIDNDHDGLTDYPSDPGCLSPEDNDETNPPPTLKVLPSSQTTSINGIAGFTASYDPDGSGPFPAQNVSGNSTWASGNTAVATLVTAGQFKGKANGTASVTATYNGLSDNAFLTVSDTPANLSVSLSASPSSGASPLSVNLTATVGGTETGTMNYSFWWNCDSSASDVQNAKIACGDPSDSRYGAKFDGSNDNPKTISHIYNAGVYVPKVIVERGASPSVTDSLAVSVSGPPPPDGPDGGSHTECRNNACVSVAGSGPNRCNINADCGADNDGDPLTPPLPFRGICDPITQSCYNSSTGEGTSCSDDIACNGNLATHLECQNNSCVIVSGAGENRCGSVGVGCTPPAACNFSASPAVITRGSYSTLRWSCVSSVSGCSINTIGSVPSIGSRQVSPLFTTKYVLTCNAGAVKVPFTLRVLQFKEIIPR